MELADGVYNAKITACQAKILSTGTPAIECMFDVELENQPTVVKRYTAFVSEKALPYTMKMLLGAGVTEKEIARIENGEENVQIALPLAVRVKIENEPSKDGTKMYANIKSVYTGSGAGLGEVAEKNAFKAAMGGGSLLAAAKAEVKMNPALSSVKAAAQALGVKGQTEPKLDEKEEVPF